MNKKLSDTISEALTRAYHLGQIYLQQADSESYAQNAASDETQKKFHVLKDQISTLLATPAPHSGDRSAREAAQRERMAERFAGRAKSPASADFDLPAPNDATSCSDEAVPADGFVDIVFDAPPGPTSPGRFIEVENDKGESISFGEWVHRPDGYWALRFTAPHSGLMSGFGTFEFTEGAQQYEVSGSADAIKALVKFRDRQAKMVANLLASKREAEPLSGIACLEKIASILACEIECSIYEKYVVPAVDIARKVIAAAKG